MMYEIAYFHFRASHLFYDRNGIACQKIFLWNRNCFGEPYDKLVYYLFLAKQDRPFLL